MAKNTKTIASMRSFNEKAKKAGVPVKNYKVKKKALPGQSTLNRNQTFTSDGVVSQQYNPDTKQFEKASSSTRSGLLAVEGQNNTKNALATAMTEKDDDGNTIRQSGRSQRANRTERTYDVKAGLNNISPRVIQAWIDNGMARVVQGGGVDVNGTVIYQKANGNFSMGLNNG